MKKIAFAILFIFVPTFLGNSVQAYLNNSPSSSTEMDALIEKINHPFGKRCTNIQESDYPTIFVPGIAASWYSAEGYGNTRVKRWIPDPVTHVYDTLFETFKANGYRIGDVFYTDEFNVEIQGNPKSTLYLFGYDWKKDNKISSTLLAELI